MRAGPQSSRQGRYSSHGTNAIREMNNGFSRNKYAIAVSAIEKTRSDTVNPKIVTLEEEDDDSEDESTDGTGKIKIIPL